MASTKQTGKNQQDMPDLQNDGNDTTKETDDTDTTKTADELLGLPVDRGWAWVILFASIYEVFIYGGIMKSYGVFFVQFQARFGSSAAETVLIQTVLNIFVSISGIFVMTIGMNHMTARTSVCLGTIITTGAYILAAYTTRIEVVIFSLGVVAGVAVAMIALPILSTIGIYFNKRRGLANSFTVAGASLGALVFGPLYTMMFDYYGYTGTMLITAGLLLNMMITGCLLRPPEYYTKNGRQPTISMSTEMKNMSKSKEKVGNSSMDGESDKLLSVTSLDNRSEPPHNGDSDLIYGDHTNNTTLLKQKNQFMRTVSEPQETSKQHWSPNIVKRLPRFSALNFQRTRALSFDPDTVRDHAPPSPLLQRTRAETFLHKRARTTSETSRGNHSLFDTINESKIALYSTPDIMCVSLASFNFVQADSNDHVLEEIIKDTENPEQRTCIQAFKSSIINFLRTVFDVSLLKDPVFIHFIVFASISLPSSVLTNVYFIPFAKDIGISNQDISVLLFVIGAVDLISRISVGLIADRKILKPTTIITCGFIIIALVNNLTRLINSFWAMLIFVVIQGSLSGVYIALYAVILIEHLGIAKFKSALGFTSMFHGGSVAAFFPITGFLRDSSGEYYWTYHVLSIMLVLGAVLSFTLPMTYKWARKEPGVTTRA